jgi:hypothetical protein
MAEGGDILYRCRYCGEIWAEEHSPSILGTLVATLSADEPGGSPPQWTGLFGTVYSIHHCQNGDLGVADLIGARHDKTDDEDDDG